MAVPPCTEASRPAKGCRGAYEGVTCRNRSLIHTFGSETQRAARRMQTPGRQGLLRNRVGRGDTQLQHSPSHPCHALCFPVDSRRLKVEGYLHYL